MPSSDMKFLPGSVYSRSGNYRGTCLIRKCTTLGPPYDPRPAVGSWGGALSYERGTPVPAYHETALPCFTGGGGGARPGFKGGIYPPHTRTQAKGGTI